MSRNNYFHGLLLLAAQEAFFLLQKSAILDPSDALFEVVL